MADKWKKVEIAPAWDFEEKGHEEFIGVFTEKQENVGPNESNMYNFEIADHSIVGVWGNAVLDIRLKNIKIGEEVKIVYLGKEKSEKTGRTYRNFEVYHRVPEFGKVDEEEVNIDDIPEDLGK